MGILCYMGVKWYRQAYKILVASVTQQANNVSHRHQIELLKSLSMALSYFGSLTVFWTNFNFPSFKWFLFCCSWYAKYENLKCHSYVQLNLIIFSCNQFPPNKRYTPPEHCCLTLFLMGQFHYKVMWGTH